jgi:hypothetical protein
LASSVGPTGDRKKIENKRLKIRLWLYQESSRKPAVIDLASDETKILARRSPKMRVTRESKNFSRS